MKKAIKKIFATAMAFTLLGTGNAITKSISSQNTTLTAKAMTVDYEYCGHGLVKVWRCCDCCGKRMYVMEYHYVSYYK